MHRFDVKTIKNVELRRKPFKTTQNCKSDQNTMTFTDNIKMMSKTSKQRKTAKVIKLDVKTSKMIERRSLKYAKLRK